MKKTMYGKCLAVLVVLSLLSQLSVGAISIGDITTEPMEPIVPKTSLGLPLADIPEVLTAEQTVQAQNVARLRDEEETQNSAVFRNADGTNTLYLFSENIWYEDANGEKHDYNTKLTQGAQAGTFVSANAGGNLVLPQSVSATTPISYTENGYTVTMYPVHETIGTGAEVMGGEGESRIAVAMTEEETARIQAINEAAAQAAGKTINAATLDAEANTVEYFRANADATIIASTLLHGVKNDLLMASDNNIRNYSFIVDTDGLTPVQSGETSIALVDDEGQLQGYINVEEIIDANGNKSFENEIEFLAKADGTYLVTMTVDEEFITEAAYPTSAAIVYATHNYDASCINDIDVGTYDPNANYSTTARMYVGRLDGEIYRAFFQFVIPTAYQFAPGAVTDAYMYLYEGSTNTSTFTIDYQVPAYQWNLSAMCWNHAANLNTMYDDEFENVEIPSDLTLSYSSQYYAKPMAPFVRACLRNYKDESLTATVNELRGFSMRLTTESASSPNIHLRIFNSTNHSSNKPYLTIYYNNNFGAATGYRDVQTEQPNCLGYALEKNQRIMKIGNYSNATDQTIINAFISIITAGGHVDSIRSISSETAAISNSEYRIAARFDRYAEEEIANYHMLVQLNDGSWAHKMDTSPSEPLGHIDPNVGEANGYWHSHQDAYSTTWRTETLYFAVDPLRD